MAKYVEINLRRGNNDIDYHDLSMEQVEEFCRYMQVDIQPEDIYCIERINSDKFVHVIIKHGKIEDEKSKSFCLDRWRNGKVCMLKSLRRKAVV